LEISRARVFPERLHPSRLPSEEENRALLDAMSTFVARTNRDDVAPLTRFLENFPDGAWAVSLRTELGCEYDRTGWYSKALDSWEQVWRARTTIEPSEAFLALHRAGSHLANLYARLGRMSELYELLPGLDQLSPTGANADRVRSAKDGLWSMEHTPEISFRCGPLALNRIRFQQNPTNGYPAAILNSKSTTNGMSLAEIAGLAAELGMNYQMAFRAPGAELILPAVVHWKVGHYAALIRERNGLCLTQDPTFGDDAWISEPALDHEGSGYFLVRSGPLPHGWRSVPEGEGRTVFGKGTTQSSNPDATTPYDNTLKDDGSERSATETPKAPCMASWDAHLMQASQEIIDTPVGYRPPFGPPIFTTVRFVQRQNERFSDAYHWTHNWQGMLYDDALNAFANVWIKVGGGWLTFVPDQTDTNIFHCQMRDPGILVRTSATNYVWQFPDGTRRIYSTSSLTNNGTLRYVSLTGIEDAVGNHVSIGLNEFARVETVTDPLGQVTQFFYELPDPGEPFPGNPFSTFNGYYGAQITRIVDPFGRTAVFQYSTTVRSVLGFCPAGNCPFYYNAYDLTNITDVAGLSSQFTYTNMSGSDCIGSLTTPYGTTRFLWNTPRARNVVFEITDPHGARERIEYSEDSLVNLPFAEVYAMVPQGMPTWNRFLYSRNTYYWSKSAFALGFATNDYSKARIYHFAHDFNINAASGLLESRKEALENRVWFNYPGQPLPTVPGTGDQPVKIGRTLDDGTTQLQQFERNSLGNITRSIDPVGRTLSFIYASNEVDLLEVRQTRAGNNELLLQATYDSRHLPLSIRNTAGQTNRYSYNGRGQLLGITNAKNGSIAFIYDAKGQLAAVDGPLPGGQGQSTFTYDAAGRLRTATDQDGYTLTVDYDDLDRITKVTYPDGTFTQTTFDRLKPGVFRDRLGRQTFFTYNSLRQLTAVQDPLGHVTRFDWCGCGSLESIIDPLGRITRWRHDIEGRITAKEYADGSNVSFEYETTTSRLRQIRDEQNQITRFFYNPDDTVKDQRCGNALIPTPAVSFAYDPDYLRVAGMTDGNGTTTFSYEPVTASPTLAAGRLTAIDGPWANDTTTFDYDELGRAVSRAVNGVAVRRTYDAAGRLTQITNALGVFNYAWAGGSGRLASMHYPNGQQTDYAYYPNAQDQLLERITHRLPNNAVLSEFTYAYDTVGQITNWTRLQGGALKTWAANYDTAERLLSVAETVSGGSSRSYLYDYDASDNRTLDQTDLVRSEFAYGSLNELVTISNSPSAGAAYEWDARNRLTAISIGTHRTEFSYDGLDRRTRIIERESGSVTNDRRYLWSGAELCEERDATGSTVLKRFFGGGLRAEPGADLPAGNYFFTRDHLQSVREMTDGTGALRAQYDYSPFGLRQPLAGDLEAGFGFTGHHRHQPSGLNLTLYRAYDPTLGRWLSRDPLAEGSDMNLYAYAYNDPLRRRDALGLEAMTLGISFYEGIGGGVSITYNPETGATSGEFEIGIGVGSSIDVNPAGESPFGAVETGPAMGEEKGVWFNEESKGTLFAEGGIVAGPFRAILGAKSEESPCQNGEFGELSNESKGCFGPFCLNKDSGLTGRADPAATKSLGDFLGTTKGHKPYEAEWKTGAKVSVPIYQPIRRD
jgi:RHS repeat-associated protein